MLALLIRSGARSSGRSGSAPSWEAAALEALHGGLVVPDRVVLVDTTGPDDADDSDAAAASEDSEGSGDSEVSDVESADDADTGEAAGVEGVDGVVFVDAEGDREDLLAEALLQAVDNADDADDPEGDASGHWLWVLGDVDGLVPDPDCLAELLAAAESHPDVGVLLPRADGARIADDAYPAERPARSSG
ncbi:hypothetical protein BJF85_23620 [Saccharomonospora sp. CUA-673]|nr:hypothetical protein BJF85_23620 [Saccharomonospora sp. CUA-673]